MPSDEGSVPALSDDAWRVALHDVVENPALLTMYAQPIVELTGGDIAGFEMLSRFTGPWRAAPDLWFSAAEHWGLNATLQSRALAAGIAARSQLPPNTFLTVNIDPHLLTHQEVAEVLTSVPDLSRVVLELTEHTRPGDQAAAAELLAGIRATGARIAMDDAGTGYAGLSTLLSLRPQIVKLDRELITGIDQDPVKRALVEVFGDLAGRMDAWVLAEGIETEGELDSLIALGVPLGQGFVLARPAAEMLPAVDREMVDHIRATAARTSLQLHVASLIRPARVGNDPNSDDVLLDLNGQAAQVREQNQPPRPAAQRWSPAMTVAPSAPLTDVARRAMSRDAVHRFAPLVCTDGQGAVIGLIQVDDLLTALCGLTQGNSDR
jgi:EAL domain-containing protein (putative c-di-GMP-specific phosphodiesterase class I)